MADAPKHPWDDWDDAKKAQVDKALDLAEGVKLYRSAGGIGVGGQWAPHSRALEQRGGLSPDEATTLARYRMFKQGAADIPTGPRAPADTPEVINARRDAFFKASPEERGKMMADDKAAIARSAEAHFDSLVAPPKSAEPEVPPMLARDGPDVPQALASSVAAQPNRSM